MKPTVTLRDVMKQLANGAARCDAGCFYGCSENDAASTDFYRVHVAGDTVELAVGDNGMILQREELDGDELWQAPACSGAFDQPLAWQQML